MTKKDNPQLETISFETISKVVDNCTTPIKKIRSKHNNLMNYFICDHKDLSEDYVKKSEKFLKEISDKLEKGKIKWVKK